MKIPFGKNDHIKIIKMIAQGLHDARALETYLELGIRRASCFNEVAPFAKRAYAVDINDCRKYIKVDDHKVNWFHCNTNEFFDNIDNDIKFDLVFIDADHNHEQSLSDFQKVFGYVKDNGLILLHDTYPPNNKFLNKHYCNDAYKTADYIRREYSEYCEIATLPFYFGISIVRKLNKQLLWMNN